VNQYTNLNLYGHLALELGADNDLNGSIANVDTTDISFLRFTGSDPIIHGLDPGYNSSNNKVLIITFIGTGKLIFKNLSDQNDSDNYRIKTPNSEDFIVPLNYGAILIYDSYDNFWHVVGEAKLAAGNNREIQFNSNGALKGSNKFLWNPDTSQLSISGTLKLNEYSFDGSEISSQNQYSNYSFGDVTGSTTLDLNNVDSISYFNHTNSSKSVITLINGKIGKTYKIIGNSNGKQYSFTSSSVIKWPSNIIPVISNTGKSDLFIFDCIASNKYIAHYIQNYETSGLF
jgi:hypothetical protein